MLGNGHLISCQLLCLKVNFTCITVIYCCFSGIVMMLKILENSQVFLHLDFVLNWEFENWLTVGVSIKSDKWNEGNCVIL